MEGRLWRGIGSTIKAICHHTKSSHGGAGHPLELEDHEVEVKIRPKVIKISQQKEDVEGQGCWVQDSRGFSLWYYQCHLSSISKWCSAIIQSDSIQAVLEALRRCTPERLYREIFGSQAMLNVDNKIYKHCPEIDSDPYPNTLALCPHLPHVTILHTAISMLCMGLYFIS